jgi:GntR family transcriptional regulator
LRNAANWGKICAVMSDVATLTPPSFRELKDSAREGFAAYPPAGPSFQPLYVQIKSLLVKQLEAGEWEPGESIPSEMDLAARYQVSQGTVRKAIDELAGENLLVRRQGKGTFVATHTETKSSMFRFLRVRRNDGQDEYPESELLEVKRARAPADVARILEISTGDAVTVLRRVLRYGGMPTVLDEITLPGALFKGITKERFDAYEGSMYGFFETEFGVRMVRAEEQVRAVAADPMTAEILRVGMGSPLLSVERVAYTYGDKPVEFRRGLCTTRSHHYANELN